MLTALIGLTIATATNTINNTTAAATIMIASIVVGSTSMNITTTKNDIISSPSHVQMTNHPLPSTQNTQTKAIPPQATRRSTQLCL